MREDLHGDVNPVLSALSVPLYTYLQEPLESVRPELQALLPAQLQHTGDPSLSYDVNWELYRALENKGALCVMVARRNSEIMGYAAAILHPHTNARKTIVGTIATWYVVESGMRGLIIRHLLTAGAEWLTQRGAKQVYIETEYANSAGPILELMGFIPIKVGYKMAKP